MFRHVLVPLDLSDRNERVLRTASEIAASSGARVTLLHVVAELAGIPPTQLRPFYEQLREKGTKKLSSSLRAMKRDEPKDRVVVEAGDPARQVVAYAARHRADLIVIGSHSVDPRKKVAREVGWGTTSYKVALLCRCPVLLVK